ncbi:MAG: two-component hybrid sensor and regulator [Verrucomicrobiaceae bacterium]|nr:two-component hybrid sensor and regulator [Verrucomicrobiaceae bacterium]
MTTPIEKDDLRPATQSNATSPSIEKQNVEHELLEAREALELKKSALAYSQAMMRATLESTTDGVLVTSETAEVLEFNEQYLQLWNLPRPLVESRQHKMVVREIAQRFADPEQFLARIAEIYATAPPATFDRLELKDGRIFERTTKVQYIEQRPVGRVWSFHNITDQCNVEKALREESRILELINSTGTILTSQLDLSALVQSLTDAATQLSEAKFGAFFYTRTDADGDVFTLFALSGAPRAAFEKFGHPRATALFGPTFHGDAPIRCADILLDPRYGTLGPHFGMPPGHLPVRSYLAVPVISRNGHVIGGLFFGHTEVGIFTERTERLIVGIAAQASVAIDNAQLYEATKQAADEREILLASERAARANAERMSAMKDEFLATLSHELRTPLSAILGWTHVLRTTSFSQADVDTGLETIERNARVQTRLIEDLLDMSRITSGKVRLDIQPIQPVSVIETAIESIRPAADAKGIRLKKMLDPSAGPISGDPNRLQQVIWNLLSNAIKFTPKGGQVHVVLGRVNSHIEISVADTGIGLTEDFLPFAFDRFRQADASLTRRHGGLGIGLSIAKDLVELHGGSISVKSAGENSGATFTVSLPLSVIHPPLYSEMRNHPRAANDASLTFQPLDLSGLKVLVVDDEPDARNLVKRLLMECNAEVFTAGTAEEALLFITVERPQVLVSDIGMPDVDGYELLRRVRALGEANGGQIPAIALTAFARSEDRTRALRAGFLVHVAKPVEASELVATVATVVGRTGILM